jgi:transposase
MAHMPDAQEIEALKKALALAQGELRVLRTERDLLQEQLNRFKRRLFDAKSEAAASVRQQDMFFNEAEAEGAKAQPATEETGDDEAGDDKIDVPAHKRARRGRKPLDPALPREVVRHELPEDERVCPHDGSVLSQIGVEVSEQLDIVPQQVRVIRHERVKYACPCCDGTIRLAARPPQVIPKGLLSEAAQAWVITAKYLDGLPLYRQAALLGRFGGTDWSRNTLAAGVLKGGLAVQPLVNLLRDEMLAAPIVYGDETELQVLKGAGQKGTGQELPVGAGDRGLGQGWHREADPAVRLLAQPQHRDGQDAHFSDRGRRFRRDRGRRFSVIVDDHGSTRVTGTIVSEPFTMTPKR